MLYSQRSPTGASARSSQGVGEISVTDPTRNPAIGRSIDAAGHRTNYHDVGEGRPVILLHGSGPGVSAWTNWAGVIPALGKSMRVIAPDIAGFGFSEFRDDTAYDIKLWVKHLFGFMDALELPTATLVGNSFGGGLALAATLRDPSRIERLVLLGTPSGEFPMTDGLRAGWFYEPTVENMKRILCMFPFDAQLVTDDMVQERYEASAREGAQEAFRKLIPTPGPEGETTIVRGVPEAALKTIEKPTMVIHGRDDHVIPLELGLRIHHCIDDSTLHSFGRCGHWVQHERRAEFLALVEGFVAEGSLR
ncbi:MAG: alpha/beta hydrolase fold protein [Actinomycetia bacterium]|nr:alpha/beta hydrolase fold protein [Actinomycetes bacterium]